MGLGSEEVALYQLDALNASYDASERTEDDVKSFQTPCFDTGLRHANVLKLKINTKLHRIMRHMGDHLMEFGCCRCGDTDYNEHLHKIRKAGYVATNDIENK